MFGDGLWNNLRRRYIHVVTNYRERKGQFFQGEEMEWVQFGTYELWQSLDYWTDGFIDRSTNFSHPKPCPLANHVHQARSFISPSPGSLWVLSRRQVWAAECPWTQLFTKVHMEYLEKKVLLVPECSLDHWKKENLWQSFKSWGSMFL